MSFADSGYGWQYPDDPNSEYTATAFIVQQILARVDTIKVVKVIAVHPGTGTPPIAGTVDVQILVNQIDGASPPNSTPHTTVYGLPYFRLRYGPWEVVGDPAVNDIGIAAASDRDISTVKSTQAQANPGSLRRFNISDGLYLGGFLNGAPTAWLWLKTDGTLAIQDKPGNILATSSTGIAATPATGTPFTVNGPLVVTGNLQLEGGIQSQTGGIYGGNLETSGNVIAGVGGGSVGLLTHKHAQPNDSHNDVEQPTAAPTAGT